MEKWDGYITSRRQEERLIEGSSGDDGGGGGCGVDDLGNGHTPACRHQSHENNPDKDISTWAQPYTYRFLLTLCGNPAEAELLKSTLKNLKQFKIIIITKKKEFSDCSPPGCLLVKRGGGRGGVMLLQHSLLVREGSVFGQIPSSTHSITADVWSFYAAVLFQHFGLTWPLYH